MAYNPLTGYYDPNTPKAGPNTGTWTPAGGGQYVGGTATNVPGGNAQVTPRPYADPVAAAAPAPVVNNTNTTTTVTVDPLEWQKTSMIAQMRDFMGSNGMGALVGAMEKYVRMGYTGDAVWVMTKNDAEYRDAYNARFAANADRAKSGLAELSPATYIEMEQGYKTAMMNRNMPAGLFDQTSDFTTLIAKDVSVREVGARLDDALSYINYDGNASVKQQLRDIYGMSDAQMASYVLDPTRTLDYLDKEVKKNMSRAEVGGAAINAGVGISGSIRDEVANLMSSTYANTAYQQATQGFNAVATDTPLYERLAKLSDTTGDANELVQEQFGLTGAADITNKKKVLASQERARFGGSSGLGSTSLSAGRRAQ